MKGSPYKDRLRPHGVDSLKELHLQRIRSNPVEGNRTRLTVVLCTALVVILLASLFYCEWHTLQYQQGNILTVSSLTRHVIAIVALLMFLLIDGSPETLALGLFFGCESIAESLSIASSIPATDVMTLSTIYFDQMASIFRLYFACQIARISTKHLNPWLILGSILTSLYLVIVALLPTFRDSISVFFETTTQLAVGLLGSFICCRVAMMISPKNLPWRVAALLIATLGFLANPLMVAADLSYDGNIPSSVVIELQIYQHVSYVLFTLAALVNMSTVENRIKALSSAKARERLERMKEEQRVHEAIAKTTQMLAHDVRKPFSLLKAYAESITAAKSTQQAKTILNRMLPDLHKSLKMVDQMIQNVMDIGRDVSLNIKPVGIQSILLQCIEQVFRLSKNQNIIFRYNFRHRGKILVDEQQLVRVFSNILENAEQAIAGRAETITISTFNDSSAIDPKISIEIHNTGSFIPQSDIKNIFDAFFTKGKNSGTGLGLAIVKKIMHSHGGSVSASSSQKTGTSFRFLIPAQHGPDEAPLTLPTSSAELKFSFSESSLEEAGQESMELSVSPTAKLLKVSILVIDDEDTYASAVEAVLRPQLNQSQSVICIATDPEQAVSLAQSTHFDFVICDYDLSSESKTGIDVLRLIKTLQPRIFTILHTNHTFTDEQLLKAKDTVHLHLQKPLNFADLTPLLDQFTQSQTKQNRSIAIIEDDLIFAEQLEKRLLDYEISHFDNPDDFLFSQKQNSTQSYSAVITDYYFTGSETTGSDIAKIIKKTTKSPVILYSNQVERWQEEFDGHITKDGSNADTVLRDILKKT